MNWSKFALGAGLAALAGALQYAEVLPPPFGALAATAFTMLAVFVPSPAKVSQ